MKRNERMMSKTMSKVSISQNPNYVGLTEKETQIFSLRKAINASANKNWAGAEFEKECSDAIAKKHKRDAKGFFTPLEIQMRDLTVGGIGTGAEMVGTDHLAGSFVDALIADSVSGRLGATHIKDLTGNSDVPVMGAPDFQMLDEGDDVNNTTPATSNVFLKPHTLAGAVPLSRRFLLQSNPSGEIVVERILRRGAAAAMDNQIFAGTGLSNQLTGLLNISGLNTVTIATPGQPTWAEIVSMETMIEEDNALLGSPAYLVAPGVKGHCKTKSKDTGSGQFIWQDDQINGYPAFSSSLLPANTIIFGNFEDLFIGLWGTLDLMADSAALAASGGVVLRVFQDFDCAVGNAVSFCKNA